MNTVQTYKSLRFLLDFWRFWDLKKRNDLYVSTVYINTKMLALYIIIPPPYEYENLYNLSYNFGAIL